MRRKIEGDRRQFLTAMAQVQQGMILGVDNNVYVEPAIWTIEWARNFSKPQGAERESEEHGCHHHEQERTEAPDSLVAGRHAGARLECDRSDDGQQVRRQTEE
jgi:hypothetical protein